MMGSYSYGARNEEAIDSQSKYLNCEACVLGWLCQLPIHIYMNMNSSWKVIVLFDFITFKLNSFLKYSNAQYLSEKLCLI